MVNFVFTSNCGGCAGGHSDGEKEERNARERGSSVLKDRGSKPRLHVQA
jgi:hypothetical protein